MPPSPERSEESAKEKGAGQEFEQALLEAQRSLDALRERYNQVRTAQQQQGTFQRRLEELQQELQEVKQQLEVLEVELESRLFSWVRLKEPFWSAIRFGGLGVLLGWLLHWWIRR